MNAPVRLLVALLSWFRENERGNFVRRVVTLSGFNRSIGINFEVDPIAEIQTFKKLVHQVGQKFRLNIFFDPGTETVRPNMPYPSGDQSLFFGLHSARFVLEDPVELPEN